MGGASAPAPMDGASSAPAPQGPNMGGDPNAMGGPNMGMDPSVGGDPNAMGGPNMGGEDPNMGMDPSMDEDPNIMGAEGDDSTMSIINQLSPDDKDAVRAYAKSMLNRDETKMGSEGGEEMGAEGPSMGGEAPMMEAVIFKKGQLRMMNENFGGDAESLNPQYGKKPLEKKNKKSVSKKSPFNSPKFK